MKIWDSELSWLLCGLFGLLVVASIIGGVLAKFKQNDTIANLNARIRAWWVMCIISVLAMTLGPIGSTVLFMLMSFYALRECVTLLPTRRSDHEALFWCFFIILPLQYLLVGIEWYGVFVILIPVYAWLFIPARLALAGDTSHFLERAAKIQWSMMIAVYCISHAPALLMLQIPGYEQQNIKLLLFLMIVVQISDVLQYVFGKLWGKRPIVPKLSPNKTVEGFVGGILSASLVGMGLWWITPFAPWQAFLISLLITLLGFLGGLCMSAIKRDRGVKDFGAMLEGHGGMMDRIDSLCFAAPVFFHVVRYFYT
ncbi:phosphatidate cytidylyltransferase [Erwinia sp. S43]|uniref:Phosphatidate cytidylyltransferase n=1 Tax=Pantoea coffeiphila TaxID=1465635 RepID=A0A2S9I3K8_9GAMM|nr:MULTISPECIES: phosphatidate cytidylyltransferase [Erwiniaceae]MBJ9999600.1 phosphatidate cytidylyltransferase [Erwinia sp. S38]MBK0033989.1 phosphatidate cytidylyltransferase [Erwinia sp. S43]MBM7342994.1 phosphatidate cytidylyltransferase [Pantoea coffeiphila]PRD12388.1 phosphatidate cytidylyltransferase [Pantoea coffeiphila]